MKYFIFVPILFLGSTIGAQVRSGVMVSFIPSIGGETISANSDLTFSENLQIETLQFYVSALELYHNGVLVFAEEDSFHLLDIEQPDKLSFRLKIPEGLRFSHLQFNLGIDSLTNVSGAFGGDLDPTNGMYWTWQSGYINFKLEGIAPECPARNNRFQFHVGGYQAPYSSLQTVALEVFDQKEINVRVAIDKALAEIDLREKFQIMSPNQEAVAFSKLLSTIFSIAE